MSHRPNFRTDVHRTQTKKWADAKSLSYEGDDWSGYDEYGDYYEEEPPPMPKPTGLRQRGQASTSPTDGHRSFTSPEYIAAAQAAAPASAGPRLQRATSFEVGDESRSFSAGAEPPAAGFGRGPIGQHGRPSGDASVPAVQGAIAAVAATSQPPSRETKDAPHGTRQPSADNSASTYGRQTAVDTRSTSPPQGYDAAQLPLQPPRKSSRRRPSPDPPVPPTSGAPQSSNAPESASYEPQAATNEGAEQPPFRFIRPSDIYKRIEAEREKQRASMDSSRPSTDSASRSTKEEPTAPVQPPISPPAPEAVAQPDPGTRGRQPGLSPVAERFSDYGMDGQPNRDLSLPQEGGDSSKMSVPSLPQLYRVSGFGPDFLNFSASPVKSSAQQIPMQEEPKHATRADTNKTLSPRDPQLQEKPSLGFRSAVEQAFEGNDESTFATSPRSTQGSQRSTADNSDVTRTDSTAGISPIMSPMPSVVIAAKRAQEREDRMMNAPPPIAEERGSPDSRPISTTKLAAPLQGSVTPTGNHSRNVSAESATTPVASDYKVDMRPSSRNNSPGRALAIETQQLTSRSGVGVVGVASPPDPQSQSASIREPDSAVPDSAVTASSRYTDREADLAADIYSIQEPPDQDLTDSAMGAPTEFANSPHDYEDITKSGSPFRSDSSMSKGRVRDLASKYDEIHDSRSQSPVGSISSRTSNRPRLKTDHSSGSASPQTEEAGETSAQTSATAEPGLDGGLLRPELPGGWVSFSGTEASNAESETRGVEEGPGEQASEPAGLGVDTPQPQTGPDLATPDEEVDLSPNTTTRDLPGKSLDESIADPMAAAVAAGSAMAASLVAAVRMSSDTNETESETATTVPRNDDDEQDSEVYDESTSLEHLRPQPLHKSARSVDSTGAPTPPPKDSPRYSAAEPASNFFPPAAPLKDQPYNQSRGLAIDTGVSRNEALMSFESSADDTENDKLAKDIVRNLTPSSAAPRSSFNDRTIESLAPSDPRTMEAQRASSVLPREYDSYWAGSPARENFNISPQPEQPVTIAPASDYNANENKQLPATPSPRPGLLDKRFSWEMDDEQEFDPPVDSSANLQPAPLSPVTVKRALEPADEELPAEDTDAAPVREDSLLPTGVMANASSSREATAMEGSSTSQAGPSDMNLRQTLQPMELEAAATSPKSSAEFSQEMSRPTTVDFTEDKRASTEETGYRQPGFQSTSAAMMSGAKIMPLKDIMALKSSNERVEHCVATREQLAASDTGLSNWLSFMIAKNPQHANAIASGVQRPTVATQGFAGSVRNKFTPSIPKLTKNSSTTPTSASPQQPYYQQYLDSAASLPSGQSPTGPAASQSSGLSPVPDKRPSTAQHSASKSSTLKGLFSKGKSKFKTGQEG